MGSIYPFYRPLDASKKEIRVLEITTKLQPASETVSPLPAVECKLHVVSLLDNPIINALSYVWGDQNIIEDIEVEGVTVPVTTSLATALKYVRGHWQNEYPDRDVSTFRIWADAVCINQYDTEERSQQVTLMGQIYRDADMVFSWLGTGNREIDEALSAFEIIATESERFEDLGKVNLNWITKYPCLYPSQMVTANGEHIHSHWCSIIKFTGISYWKRVWIFQEVALARDVLLIHGSTRLHFHRMESALVHLLCYEKDAASKFDYGDDDFFHFIRDFLALSLNDLGTLRLVAETRSIVNRWQSSELSTEDFRAIFDRIVLAGYRLHCSDPRDYIYGLSGLADIGITPDYQRDFRSVMLDLANSWIQRTKSLEILSLSGIGSSFQTTHDVPSWAPQLAHKSKNLPRTFSREGLRSFSGTADRNVFRDRFDSSIAESTLSVTALVGPKVVRIRRITNDKVLQGMTVYDVDVLKDLALDTDSRKRASTDELNALRDLALDLIHLYPQGISGTHPCLALLQLITEKPLTHPKLHMQALTMFLDLKVDAPGQLSLLVKQLPKRDDKDHNDSDLFPAVLRNNSGKESNKNSKYSESEKIEAVNFFISWRMTLVTNFIQSQRYGYSFMETDNGYLGLVPSGTQEGDHVCIVQGCAVPILLRKAEDHFINVGACGVAGLMEGEAVKWIENGTSNPQRIKIR